MRSGSAAVPDGAVADGKVADPATVGRTLRSLLARTEIDQTRALVAAGDSVATFRIMRVPLSATSKEVDGAIARELPFEPQRMATRWTDVGTAGADRVVYAVAWDRGLVKNVTDAVKLSGVEPIVVELKSASLARVVAEPTCVLVDLTASPAEILLVDEHLPQVWHRAVIEDVLSSAMAPALAGAIRTVLRYYRRRSTGVAEAHVPVLVSCEQAIAPQVLAEVADRVGQAVSPLPTPARVPASLRHSTYLACLGLLMRRES